MQSFGRGFAFDGDSDALVVDASYREQVLTMEEGCEDRYLFVQKSYSGKSLLDVLELNDSMNDIFSNQRLTGIFVWYCI